MLRCLVENKDARVGVLKNCTLAKAKAVEKLWNAAKKFLDRRRDLAKAQKIEPLAEEQARKVAVQAHIDTLVPFLKPFMIARQADTL